MIPDEIQTQHCQVCQELNDTNFLNMGMTMTNFLLYLPGFLSSRFRIFTHFMKITLFKLIRVIKHENKS